MTENYRDICEFDNGDEGTDEAEESAAGSVPPWVDLLNPESTGQTAIDLLRDPNEGMEENLYSPDPEILRGRIESASRSVLLISQNLVYNFPFRRSTPKPMAVGLRNFDMQSLRRGFRNCTSLLQAPSTNPEDYAISGEHYESISAVANKQDSLMYAAGKIYVAPDGEAFRHVQQTTLNFKLYNPHDLTDSNRSGMPVGNTDFDPKLIVKKKRINTNVGPGEEGGPEFFLGETTRWFIGLNHDPQALSQGIGCDWTVEGAEDYLLGLLPSSDITFIGGFIQGHAALFKSELNFTQRPPGCYAGIEVNYPKMKTPIVYEIGPGILELENNEYYQKRSKTRREKFSIYSEVLGNSDLTSSIPFLTDPDGRDIPTGIASTGRDCTVVEKFSSHRMMLVEQINTTLKSFMRQDSQDENRLRWLDNFSPLSVNIEIEKPQLNRDIHGAILDTNSMIVRHGLDSVLLSLLASGFSDRGTDWRANPIDDQTVSFKDLYAYSLDQNWSDPAVGENEFYQDRESDYTPNEKVEFNYRPRQYLSPIKVFKSFNQRDSAGNANSALRKAAVIDRLFKNLSEFPLLFEDSSTLVETNDEGLLQLIENRQVKAEIYNEIEDSVSEFERELMDLLYPGGVPDRKYIPQSVPEMFGEHRNKMCILAYRVEKVNVYTGKVLKEFYLYNNPDLETINFIDSEVAPADKYRYNIYTINFVAGYKYRYKEEHRTTGYNAAQRIRHSGEHHPNVWEGSGFPADDFGTLEGHVRSLPTISVDVQVFPDLKIIELPFFSQEVCILDHPPLTPDVNLDRIGRSGESSQDFRVRFSTRIGKSTEVPIAILEGEEEKVLQMKTDQILTRPPETPEDAIIYSSDTPPDNFEVLVLSTEPSGYQDFKDADSYSFPSTSPFFTFTAPVNEERYFIFRAHDQAGFSNPTKIFKFIFHSYGDGEYYEFDVFEPELEIYQQPLEMSCERYLSIEPSAQQSFMNFGVSSESTPDQISDLLSSENIQLEDISMGHVEEEREIWNKNYKIRLRSTNTGRAIDLNFKFVLEKIDSVDASSGVQARIERAEIIECHDEISSKNNRIREIITKSNEALRDNLGEYGSDE
tara:strand:- start:2931 stop:6206 length:3276 start_codon:yes stop_codon:yes gene_type:complete